MATALRKATPVSMGPSLHGRRIGIDDANNLLQLGIPYRINMTAAAGATNVSAITCTVVDYLGNTVPNVFNFDLWFSDDADGAGLSSTSPSGTIAATSGAILSGDVSAAAAKLAIRAQTLKTGIGIFSITDSAKTAYKVAAQLDARGGAFVGVTLATASYG